MPSPIGHALAGLAAALGADLVPGRRAWRTAPPSASLFLRAGGTLTVICLALAVFPDIDLLFRAHRSVTHSVTAVAIVTIIAGVVTDRVTQRPVARVALMCGAAYATHLLLDWMAVDTYPPYGIQLFWPFSSRWYMSSLSVFPQTERLRVWSLRAIRINLLAMAWETAILLPVVGLVWLVRVKTLARFAAKMARSDHSTQ